MPAASPLENSARRAAALRFRVPPSGYGGIESARSSTAATMSRRVTASWAPSRCCALRSDVAGHWRLDVDVIRNDTAAGPMVAADRSERLPSTWASPSASSGSRSRGWQASQNCRPFVRRNRNVSEGWS